MNGEPLGRREFLKLAVATAAAAGLSHFRFLNAGGAGLVPIFECEPGDPGPADTCDPTSVDWCVPTSTGGGDPDLCSPDPGPNPADMCPDDSPNGDGDNCTVGGNPDACSPSDEPADWCDMASSGVMESDLCVGDTGGDGDLCQTTTTPADFNDVCSLTEPDQCAPPLDPDSLCNLIQEFSPDICGDGQIPASDVCDPVSFKFDACEPAATAPEPDVCQPGYDPDLCLDLPDGDGDLCAPTASPPEPDVCSPTWDPDESGQPNPVTLASLEAGSPGAGLPLLGAAAGAVTLAALWLRRRLRPREEEDAT